MNIIQRFIILNLFKNTKEVFEFIRQMQIAKKRNELETLAFKYNATKLKLIELNKTPDEHTKSHAYLINVDNTIAGMQQ